MVLAGDIVLVIVSAIFLVILIIGCIYFLVYFQHPDDKLVAWFPKIIVVMGLVVSGVNVLLLPLDVATQGSSIEAVGIFPMQEIEYSFFLISIILFFAVIPFTYFYYEGYDEDEFKQSVIRQICNALQWVVPVIIIIAGIIVGVYWFYGFIDIPITIYTSPPILATAENTILTQMCTAGNGCTSCNQSIIYRVSPVVYIISIINIVGFIVLVSFGGVGLTALPLDLILEFMRRPRRIGLQEYSKRKLIMGERAESLLRDGEKINQQREDASKLKSGKRKAMRKVNEAQSEFKRKVLLLETEFKELETAYKNQGGNIIWQWAKFLFGILGSLVSFFWILQIALFILPQAVGKPPVTELLNAFFTDVSKAPIFGPLFYGLFAFYMLLCVVKGNIKLGFRFIFIQLYPLELHDTMMNALLFNTGLIVAGSLAVVQLCTVAFADYAIYTSINGTFYVQISNLRGIRYIFDIYSFVILGFAVLTLLYLAIKPGKKPQVTSLQKVEKAHEKEKEKRKYKDEKDVKGKGKEKEKPEPIKEEQEQEQDGGLV